MTKLNQAIWEQGSHTANSDQPLLNKSFKTVLTELKLYWVVLDSKLKQY